MSDETFHSRSGYFSGTIPKGWFSSSDTSVAQSLEAWLLNDDFTAAIVIRELHLDETAKRQVEEEGLEYLAEISKSFGETDTSTTYQHQLEFSSGKTKFFSYEQHSAVITKRVIVFSINNHFFECEATPVNSLFDGTFLINLFSVQQSVITSLKFPTPLPQ
ncbi:MAG: hypothetical protein HY960_04810 [Ignavibacteriae bacterium]|nr:hypothetical protein [Ignavibacteriota bacterium]